jgi:hypothetical protein
MLHVIYTSTSTQPYNIASDGSSPVAHSILEIAMVRRICIIWSSLLEADTKMEMVVVHLSTRS